MKLIDIAQADITLRRVFFGRVAASETVDIAFQVSGQVVSLLVIEGKDFAKGEVIAARDRAVNELDLQSAQLRLNQARRPLTGPRQLAGTTAIQVASDDTETALASAACRSKMPNSCSTTPP